MLIFYQFWTAAVCIATTSQSIVMTNKTYEQEQLNVFKIHLNKTSVVNLLTTHLYKNLKA